MSCYILSLISANDFSAKQIFYTRKFLSFQFLCCFIIVFNDYRHSFVPSFCNFSFIWSNIFWNVPQLINKSQHIKIKLQNNSTYTYSTLDFPVYNLLWFANVSEGGRNMSFLCLLIASHLVVFVAISFLCRFSAMIVNFRLSQLSPELCHTNLWKYGPALKLMTSGL